MSTTTSNGRSGEQARVLRDVYGEMKVIDAKENLRVFVDNNDILGAKRNNICECVYARACRRLFGSKAVVFFRSIAYVDLPNEDGIRQVNRFTLGAAIRDRIIEFDKTGKAHPGGFLLSAPPKSKTLDGIRERGAGVKAQNPVAWRAKRKIAQKRHSAKRKAVILGHLRPAEYSIDKTIAGPIGYVRSGLGMAQFTTKKKRAA